MEQLTFNKTLDGVRAIVASSPSLAAAVIDTGISLSSNTSSDKSSPKAVEPSSKNHSTSASSTCPHHIHPSSDPLTILAVAASVSKILSATRNARFLRT